MRRISILGGILVLWKHWVAWLHVPAVMWFSLVNRFRRLAGQAGYESGFVQHYVAPWSIRAGYPAGWSR